MCDDSEGPHCLTVTLEKYGKGPLREGERWVLLEHARKEDGGE